MVAVIGLQPDVTLLRQVQTDLLTESGTLLRGATNLGTILLRVGAERTFTSPADPQDANLRSIVEWGYTFKWNSDVRVGDTLLFGVPVHRTVIGEVMDDSTWQLAVRAYGARPKYATPTVSIILWRWNATSQDFSSQQAPQSVKVVYDNVQPDQAPLRYTPAGRSLIQTGRLIAEDPQNAPFNVQVGDRFDLFGYPAVVTSVLGGQPLTTEARFEANVGSAL
jgi:hypothetical protein